MRTLGIIGGTGPETTIEYYRRLISAYRERTLEGRAPSLMFLLLQELSTLVGFAIVALIYWLWLRGQQVSSSVAPGSDRWRYLLWLGILMLSLVISLPAAASYATSASLPDVPFVRSILFRTATYSPAIAVPLGLVATGIIYARRDRQTFPRVNPTSQAP